MNHFGISAIGLSIPSLSLPVEELASLRGVDPGKYKVGLGCANIALCGESETVVSLAVQAARRALSQWGGRLEDIGLLVTGTETAVDMSRPLSAFVASELGLKGATRSYEVKHACYGGTVALRQAIEWKASGAAETSGKSKAALVIAADVALYAQNDPGEPTQGAGAVAMIIDEPVIASIDVASFAYSEPAFDFWRPVGEDHPRVDGPLSLDCYKRGAENCFRDFVDYDGRDAKAAIGSFTKIAFHVPFPKMVKKAVQHVGPALGLSEPETAALFESKVEPTMQWNRETGNSYTASLWTSVASVLWDAQPGDRIAAFSYGSGFGAELVTLTAHGRGKGTWGDEMKDDLDKRTFIDASQYDELRKRLAKH